MKKRGIIIFFVLSLILEITLSFLLIDSNSKIKNDTIKINELVQEVEKNFGDSSKYPNFYVYSIIDNDKNVLYKSDENATYTLPEAYKNGDVIIDLYSSNTVVGKLIVRSEINDKVKETKSLFVASLIAISVTQVIVFVLYLIYLNKKVFKPFKEMISFAERLLRVI